jgi:hypothetical protein
MVIIQLFGWPYYLFTNVMGSPMYPPGTNVGNICITDLLLILNMRYYSTSNLPLHFSNLMKEMGSLLLTWAS